jgi:hypothetical protein
MTRQDQLTDPSLSATTTYQQDLVSAGQRRVNLIWEYTQSFVTIAVVVTNMIVAATNAIAHGTVAEHPAILSSSLFLILGFYYSRTNHTAVGGVGIKPSAPYIGR